MQSQEAEVLFKERSYKEVIRVLLRKEASQKLSTEESFILSISHSRIGELYESLAILDRVIIETTAIKDTINLFKAYNLKAENFVDLSKIKEGVALCDSILPVSEKNNSNLLEGLCIKCGILYDEQGSHQKAYETYNKIQSQKLKESAIYINNYGVILMNLEKYDEALYFLKKGIDVHNAANKRDNNNVALANIAKIHMQRKEWGEAKKYLDSASNSLTPRSKASRRKKLYQYYYHFYKLQNKLNHAKNVVEQIDMNNDLIVDEKIDEKLSELKAIDNRKQTLHKQVTKINSQIQKSKRQQLISYITLLSIVILVLIGIFFHFYRSIKMKYRNLINEQEILVSQMTPHFIFNSLSVLQGMILNSESKKATAYVSKFSSLLRLTLKEGTRNFIAIEEELTGLQDYIDLQNMSTERTITYTFTKDHFLKENNPLIPSMILQPFIENAIIHGFKEEIEAPIIRIKLSRVQKKILCIIEDNGIGYLAKNDKAAHKKTSLAIHIVKERLTILSDHIKSTPYIHIEDLKAYNQQGTRVTLELPYQNQKRKHSNLL
ncbi:hypothetical protein GCM10022393_05140 [Aquimarina addita]|uniref:Signal transduction histidine kinase internal region domain-containing protein n=1 Tax=Aquimarina addita TaxID=870485 RepID=A0ABP7XCC2_9FLAO